jgi:hypothetical protein
LLIEKEEKKKKKKSVMSSSSSLSNTCNESKGNQAHYNVLLFSVLGVMDGYLG